MPTLGSLCSGFGGLDLGLQRAGFTVAWHVEPDAACTTVLERHWPGVPNHGNLKTVDWDTVDPVDTLCGGYPCQPFSHAGRRLGEDDPRHLWPYVCAAVRALRPGLVILENVAGHRSLGFGRVLGDLAEIGYDATWASVRASDVGAPHGRERVFILAAPADAGRVEHGEPAPDPLDERGRLNVNLTRWMMGFPPGWHGDTKRGAALRGYGNAVQVQVAEAVGRWALS